MSQEKKRAKLHRLQVEIAGIIGNLEQIENEEHELIEATETLEIELSELQKKEAKIQAKLLAKN